MRGIFKITERETAHPVASMVIAEPIAGRIDISIACSKERGPQNATITLDRAEALELAAAIRDKLLPNLDDLHGSKGMIKVPVDGINFDRLGIQENDIVKVVK